MVEKAIKGAKMYILMLFCLLIFLALFNTVRFRIKNGPSIKVARTREFPQIVKMLSKEQSDGSFVMFTVPNTIDTDGQPLTVQFSVERGSVGFDWLLTSLRAKKDRGKFVEFSKKEKVTVQELVMEDVKYLRVELENDALAEFGTKLLEKLYDVSSMNELEVFADASNWRKTT